MKKTIIETPQIPQVHDVTDVFSWRYLAHCFMDQLWRSYYERLQWYRLIATWNDDKEQYRNPILGSHHIRHLNIAQCEKLIAYCKKRKLQTGNNLDEIHELICAEITGYGIALTTTTTAQKNKKVRKKKTKPKLKQSTSLPPKSVVITTEKPQDYIYNNEQEKSAVTKTNVFQSSSIESVKRRSKRNPKRRSRRNNNRRSNFGKPGRHKPSAEVRNHNKQVTAAKQQSQTEIPSESVTVAQISEAVNPKVSGYRLYELIEFLYDPNARALHSEILASNLLEAFQSELPLRNLLVKLINNVKSIPATVIQALELVKKYSEITAAGSNKQHSRQKMITRYHLFFTKATQEPPFFAINTDIDATYLMEKLEKLEREIIQPLESTSTLAECVAKSKELISNIGLIEIKGEVFEKSYFMQSSDVSHNQGDEHELHEYTQECLKAIKRYCKTVVSNYKSANSKLTGSKINSISKTFSSIPNYAQSLEFIGNIDIHNTASADFKSFSQLGVTIKVASAIPTPTSIQGINKTQFDKFVVEKTLSIFLYSNTPKLTEPEEINGKNVFSWHLKRRQIRMAKDFVSGLNNKENDDLKFLFKLKEVFSDTPFGEIDFNITVKQDHMERVKQLPLGKYGLKLQGNTVVWQHKNSSTRPKVKPKKESGKERRQRLRYEKSIKQLKAELLSLVSQIQSLESLGNAGENQQKIAELQQQLSTTISKIKNLTSNNSQQQQPSARQAKTIQTPSYSS